MASSGGSVVGSPARWTRSGLPEVYGCELAESERREIGALPVGFDQEIVGIAERHEAALETLDELLRRRRAADRLMRDRLDDGERILDPVREFAKQQPLLPLPGFPLGDISRAFKSETTAGIGYEFDIRLDYKLAAVLGAMADLAAPAAGLGELLLERGEGRTRHDSVQQDSLRCPSASSRV